MIIIKVIAAIISFLFFGESKNLSFTAENPNLQNKDTLVEVKFSSKKVDSLLLHTANMPKFMPVITYKPDGYNEDSIFPVVYLLHGFSGNSKVWKYLFELNEVATELNAVIVCPDGNYDCWYVNSPINKSSKFEDYFFDELMPSIQKRYSIDTSKVIVTGYSMGGHGALSLYLKHPDKFFAVGSSSGVIDLNFSHYIKESLSKIVGSTKKELLAYSVITKLDTMKHFNKNIYIDCGKLDYLLPCNNELKKQLDAMKVKCTYITLSGHHSSDYWRQAFPMQFKQIKNWLKN